MIILLSTEMSIMTYMSVLLGFFFREGKPVFSSFISFFLVFFFNFSFFTFTLLFPSYHSCYVFLFTLIFHSSRLAPSSQSFLFILIFNSLILFRDFLFFFINVLFIKYSSLIFLLQIYSFLFCNYFLSHFSSL